jgi:hypothetical protein
MREFSLTTIAIVTPFSGFSISEGCEPDKESEDLFGQHWYIHMDFNLQHIVFGFQFLGKSSEIALIL